jgi:hypothetical protein
MIDMRVAEYNEIDLGRLERKRLRIAFLDGLASLQLAAVEQDPDRRVRRARSDEMA